MVVLIDASVKKFPLILQKRSRTISCNHNTMAGVTRLFQSGGTEAVVAGFMSIA